MPHFTFIMAVDPGITTGLAYGIVDHLSDVATSELIAGNAEGLTVEQVYNKDEVKSGIEIATLFMTLRQQYLAIKRPRCSKCVLVIEDFLLRGRVGSTKREGLAPVRVTTAIHTTLMLKKVPFDNKETILVRRLPSEAMAYATNPRLKDMGIYPATVGKEHGRDAARHWCTQVAKMRGDLRV